MKRLLIIVRILTLVSFLAPFITCNNYVLTAKEAMTDTAITVVDTATVVDSAAISSDSISEKTLQSFPEINEPYQKPLVDKILDKIIFPTDNSISGVGSIMLFQGLTGEISLGLSFILSLFLLFPWRFLRIKKRRLYLNSLNLISVTVFIIAGLFFSKENLLWGVWVLLALIISSWIIEFKSVKNSSNNSQFS